MCKIGNEYVSGSLTVLLLALVVSSFASDKVFENVENSTYTFHYNRDNPTKSNTNNFFIREMARHNLNSLNSTSFTYYYSVHQSIARTETNTFLVKTKVNGEKCTGDIYYRDFDISDILMPDHADLNISIYTGETFLENFYFKDVTQNKNKEFELDFVFEGNEIPDSYWVRVENVDFYSGDNNKDLFFNRIHVIDTYYAGIAVVERLTDQIDAINVKDSYSIPDSYIKLKETERVYDAIKSFNFPPELGLAANDKAGYYTKLNKLERKINKYKCNYNQLLASVDFIKIDSRFTEIAEKYVNLISRYFELSQVVTHWQSSIYYDLGLINYNNEMLESYFNGFKKIIDKTGACNDETQVLNILKEQIFQSYLKKATMFMNEEKFNLAIAVLRNAEGFYKLTNGNALPVEYNISNATANYGIYTSYIQVADRAIDVGNYELAENYINKAREFQKQHSETIITDKYLKNMTNNLIDLYVVKGNRLNESRDFLEAKHCFEQAQRLSASTSVFNKDYDIKHGLDKTINGLYNSYVEKARIYFDDGDFYNANEEIMKAQDLYNSNSSVIMPSVEVNNITKGVNQSFYSYLVMKGKINLDAGSYQLAYESLGNALKLKSEFNLPEDTLLMSLFKKAAALVVIDKCEVAQNEIEQNNIVIAKAVYDECMTLQVECGLEKDADVQKSLWELNSSLFVRNCENKNKLFLSFIDKADMSVNSGDFIGAVNILDKSFNISDENPYCEFDIAMAEEHQSKYKPAARYQILAKEAQKALLSEDRESFLKIYEEMEQISAENEIVRTKIEPMPLFYLFSIKNNLALFEKSIEQYDNRAEFETAMKLLKTIEANHYSMRDTRTIQEHLAYKMAESDKDTGGVSNPKINVEKYTEGKPWYKFFKKAYIKNSK